MKNITKIAGVAAVAFALTQTVQAVPITGNILFTGNVTYDTSSAATATQVTGWSATAVTGVSVGSSFAAFITPVIPATFNNSVVWNLNTINPNNINPLLDIANFWQAGGFSFTLDSSFILSQGGTPGVNGFLVADGVGTVSGHGFDPTIMDWSFTSDRKSVV